MQRDRVGRGGVRLLLVLAAQPRALVGAGVLALLAGVLLLPTAPAVLCLLVLLGLLAWLTSLSWPVLDGRARALRLVVAAGLLALGLAAAR